MRLFSKGDRVNQPNYGAGTIVSTDEQYVVVDFDEHGPKKFVTHMVALEPSSAPAPEGSGGTKSRRARAPRKTKARKTE